MNEGREKRGCVGEATQIARRYFLLVATYYISHHQTAAELEDLPCPGSFETAVYMIVARGAAAATWILHLGCWLKKGGDERMRWCGRKKKTDRRRKQ